MISLNHMADFYLLFMVQYYTGEWNYRQEAWWLYFEKRSSAFSLHIIFP